MRSSSRGGSPTQREARGRAEADLDGGRSPHREDAARALAFSMPMSVGSCGGKRPLQAWTSPGRHVWGCYSLIGCQRKYFWLGKGPSGEAGRGESHQRQEMTEVRGSPGHTITPPESLCCQGNAPATRPCTGSAGAAARPPARGFVGGARAGVMRDGRSAHHTHRVAMSRPRSAPLPGPPACGRGPREAGQAASAPSGGDHPLRRLPSPAQPPLAPHPHRSPEGTGSREPAWSCGTRTGPPQTPV
ncbi:atherin-like isoform X2 [Rousettus aegyptiacus]|uniref:atherin-like isoform X2 n=1 Tax=Rousettus aegyptiacus TaxID=9407 RepID=UPI00168D203C|nr:atherin-like isoform X2 [Rousettus aegyptiacus]